MILKSALCVFLLIATGSLQIECRSYNNGLIFYNLENHNPYLPPTISVSRGRVLAKFKYSPRGSIWSTFGRPCHCEGPLCSCCVGIKVKQYNFDQKMCANVSYAHPRDEVQLEVFLNDTATAKYGISARNPSPLCVPIMMGIPMSMCIQMSNIGVQGDNLNMCMDFLVRLASTELFEMHFQCMKVGLQGASWVGPDGQPVIPANEGKLKDKISIDSDEYYDESEAENEIISNEDEGENGASHLTQDNDLNKAEEEMDNNDITEKIMDIVKKKEQQAEKGSSEASEENKVEGVFSVLQDNNKVEEIVTNIMESINQANMIEKIDKDKEQPNKNMIGNINKVQVLQGESNDEKPVAMEAEKSSNEEQVEELNIEPAIKIQTKEENNESNALQENISKSEKVILNPDTDDVKKKAESFVLKNSTNLIENALKNEFNVEELFEDSQVKEMQIESDLVNTQDTIEAPSGQAEEQSEKVMTPIIVLDETTTVKIMNDVEMAANEHSEILQNTDDNKILELTQPIMESKTQPITKETNAFAITQNPTMTDATSGINVMDNSLTTAAIITTTNKTISATNKPIKPDGGFVAAATFTNNTKTVDDEDEDVEEEDENSADNDDDDEDSHENDSDYEDEESDENENETKEKITEFHKATFQSIVKSNLLKADNKENNDPKESLLLQKKPAGNSISKESQPAENNNNENTDDEFETEEGEEYDDDYEDYETTAADEVYSSNKDSKRYNTCCKPVITMPSTIKPFNHNNNKAEIPPIETTSSQDLQRVSTSNSTISQTNDKNMFNTKSTNKMPQTTIKSITTTTTAAASTTNAASKTVMPLPLVRKLHYTSSHHQHQPQQLKRQNRQLQHYV